MLAESIHTFLISMSPLGEARVGIPVGVVRGLHPVMAFAIGLGANLLVYPLFNWFINKLDHRLWKYKPYRKQSIKLMKRAKGGVGNKIQKYGFWGLMFFVMIPLPITGAYMGVIAARVLAINSKSAFKAISLGILISCTIVGAISLLGAEAAEVY